MVEKSNVSLLKVTPLTPPHPHQQQQDHQQLPPPLQQDDLSTTIDGIQDQNVGVKTQLDSNVVIMMDSNVNFIHLNKVWNKTSKIKTGKSNLLLEEVNNHDFSKVKMVIIGTGTNDTTEETAETIFKNLVHGGFGNHEELPKGKGVYCSNPAT